MYYVVLKSYDGEVWSTRVMWDQFPQALTYAQDHLNENGIVDYRVISIHDTTVRSF